MHSHFGMKENQLIMENILKAFSDDSKVWIYLANREFTSIEAMGIDHLLNEFSTTWTSHGHKVYGKAFLFENRFIIFVADESKSGVSGCSIDKTVAIVRDITNEYKVNLMDRSLVAIIREEKLEVLALDALQEEIRVNAALENVLVYNTLIHTKAALTHWLIPYNESKFIHITPLQEVKFSLN
jgi:hypothetical protein